MIKKHTDRRFTTVTGTEIHGLYRKIPNQFGGFLIEISYKLEDTDIFSKRQYIDIDQSNFDKELIEFYESKDKDKRLYYTFGMGDIDIFRQNDQFVIYYSPHDGAYIYYYFTDEEFKKLYQWLKLDK